MKSGSASSSGAVPDESISGIRRWGPFVTAVLAVLLVDQLSKLWVMHSLTYGEPRDLFWTLRLNLAFNTGMAFSKGSGSGPIIGVVVLVIVTAIVLFARKSRSLGQLLLLGTVVGGAIGNVIDRIIRVGDLGSTGSGFMSGAVVDFIDLQWWPIFNVADACVVVGGILLAVTGFREPVEETPDPVD